MIYLNFVIFIVFFLVLFSLPSLYFLTKKKIFIKLFFGFWSIIFFLIGTIFLVDFVNSKTKVSKKDIIGKYYVDKNMFKGKNADWQYEHFDFEITSYDEFILFEYFDSGKIKSVHKGKVNYIEGYASPHLKITNLNPEHQIVDKEPLLVRGNWSFYYVFKSKKFGNMFFKKKKLVFYKF